MVETVRHETANAIKLFRLRLRDARKAMMLSFALVAMLLVVNVTAVIVSVAQGTGDGTSVHHLPDYSAFLLLLAPLVIAYICWQDAAGANLIYPQTSTSRYLSTLMLSFALVLIALVAVLASYLIMHLLFLLLGAFGFDIILGLGFGIGHMAAGFLSAFAFLVMITTIIATVSFLVRSFRLYAVVPIMIASLVILLSAVSLLPQVLIDGIATTISQSVVGLFTNSLTSFLLTCFAVTVAFLVFTALLKLAVKEGQGSKSTPILLAAVYVPWIIAMLAIGVSLYANPGEEDAPSSAIAAALEAGAGTSMSPVLKDEPVYVTIHMLPSEEDFNQGRVPFAGDLASAGWEFQDDVVLFELLLEETTVHIAYFPPHLEFLSESLQNQLQQPYIEAYLEGNGLQINFRPGGDTDVVLMPIWSMLWFFEDDSTSLTSAAFSLYQSGNVD